MSEAYSSGDTTFDVVQFASWNATPYAATIQTKSSCKAEAEYGRRDRALLSTIGNHLSLSSITSRAPSAHPGNASSRLSSEFGSGASGQRVALLPVKHATRYEDPSWRGSRLLPTSHQHSAVVVIVESEVDTPSHLSSDDRCHSAKSFVYSLSVL